MRKNLMFFLVTVVLLVACTQPKPIYESGSYKGVAEGYHSNLIVEVTTDEFNIIGIEIIEEDETPIIAEIVYEEIPKAVKKANSTDVDVVAGATYTSETLLKAIENGLVKARLKAVDLSNDEER